jgi:hypothetical protein
MNPIAARSSSKVSGSKSGGCKASHGTRAPASAGQVGAAHAGEMRRGATGVANEGEMETGPEGSRARGSKRRSEQRKGERAHGADVGPLAAAERFIVKLCE